MEFKILLFTIFCLFTLLGSIESRKDDKRTTPRAPGKGMAQPALPRNRTSTPNPNNRNGNNNSPYKSFTTRSPPNNKYGNNNRKPSTPCPTSRTRHVNTGANKPTPPPAGFVIPGGHGSQAKPTVNPIHPVMKRDPKPPKHPRTTAKPHSPPSKRPASKSTVKLQQPKLCLAFGTLNGQPRLCYTRNSGSTRFSPSSPGFNLQHIVVVLVVLFSATY